MTLRTCSYHHFDLDGCVSKIFHDKIYGKADTFKCSGYGKIDENLDKLISEGYESITFTDMAITPEQMEKCVNSFKEVRFFDHHQITEETYNLYKDHPNVKECVFREDLSGAGIMFVEYMQKTGPKTPELAKLAMLGDVYDLWKQDNQYWTEAFDLNTLFWRYSFWEFEKRFSTGFTDFTTEEREWLEENTKNIEKILDSSPAEEIDDKSFIIFVKDRNAISFLQSLIPEYCLYYIISYDDLNNNYGLSLRIKDTEDWSNAPNAHEALSKVAEEHPLVVSGGGHVLAGGMSFTDSIKIDEVMDIIKNHIHTKFTISEEE